jgi:hypothetical protein
MSIMVLQKETIEKLGNSFLTVKRATYERIDLGQWYKLLKDAYSLNIKSWNERYTDDIITDEEQETIYKINSRSKEKFKNPCEILKALQCLEYNIELDNMNSKEKKIESDLKAVIVSLKDYIIFNLEDYKKEISRFDAAVLMTPWQEYVELLNDSASQYLKTTILFDACRALQKNKLLESGIKYIGIGLS